MINNSTLYSLQPNIYIYIYSSDTPVTNSVNKILLKAINTTLPEGYCCMYI